MGLASWSCLCGFDAQKRQKMFFCLCYISVCLFLSVSRVSVLCGPFVYLYTYMWFLHIFILTYIFTYIFY